MDSETINRSIKDGVYTIQITRPKKYNALSNYINAKILEFLEEARKDDTVKIVYFTGSGSFFTSGNDFNNFEGNSYKLAADSFKGWVDYLIDYPKVLIAGINGMCIGIGFTMLLHFDVVLASRDAVFFTPFVQTFQSPEGCSTALFASAVGHSNAGHLLILGGRLTAEDLQKVGFITNVWDAEEFEEKAREYCQEGTKLDLETMINIKRVIKSRKLKELKEVNEYEADELRKSWEKPKFATAIAKFVKPNKAKF